MSSALSGEFFSSAELTGIEVLFYLAFLLP